jgi:hypothetical protein
MVDGAALQSGQQTVDRPLGFSLRSDQFDAGHQRVDAHREIDVLLRIPNLTAATIAHPTRELDRFRPFPGGEAQVMEC